MAHSPVKTKAKASTKRKDSSSTSKMCRCDSFSKCVSQLTALVEELTQNVAERKAERDAARVERDQCRKERDALIECLQYMDKRLDEFDKMCSRVRELEIANESLTAALAAKSSQSEREKKQAITKVRTVLMDEVMQERDIAITERNAADKEADEVCGALEHAERRLNVAGMTIQQLERERNKLSMELNKPAELIVANGELEKRLMLAVSRAERLERA